MVQPTSGPGHPSGNHGPTRAVEDTPGLIGDQVAIGIEWNSRERYTPVSHGPQHEAGVHRVDPAGSLAADRSARGRDQVIALYAHRTDATVSFQYFGRRCQESEHQAAPCDAALPAGQLPQDIQVPLRDAAAFRLRRTRGIELEVGRVGPWYPEGWLGREVGWTISPDHLRQGYAFEAARASLEYACTHLGWREVIHVIMEGNEASIALARKLGSTLIRSEQGLPGVTEKTVLVFGQPLPGVPDPGGADDR